MNVGDTLKLAVEVSGKPAKVVARECNYSDDALYAAINNLRSIPTQARTKLAQLNLVGMMAVTLEATGMTKLFGYLRVDRHVQSLLQRVMKEDREADEIIRRLPELLLDKPTRADLTPDDIESIQLAGSEIADRINADINLLAELDRQYGISFSRYLTDKEKTASTMRAAK